MNMKYLRHFLNVLFTILITTYPYSRFLLLFDYVKINFRSVLHHKIRMKKGDIFHATVLGYHIRFLTYAHLVNLLEEIFVFQVYRFQTSRKAPHIVDCGSNIGLSVLYFKKIFPESHIIAFEPDTEAFSMLDFVVRRNHLTHIQLYNSALGNVEGETKLFRESPAALTATVFPSNNTEFISVNTVKLSDILLQETDLVKIDIEGSEAYVIEDLVKSNAINRIETLIIEYHPRLTKIPLAEFIFRITTHGFTCTKSKPTSESTEPDYLLYFQKVSLQN